MKFLPFLLLCSCSTFYYPNGQKLAFIGSDVRGLRIVARGITVEAASINNSSIHRAAGDTVNKVGVAVATSGILTVIPH